jgi:hypothetical protein
MKRLLILFGILAVPIPPAVASTTVTYDLTCTSTSSCGGPVLGMIVLSQDSDGILVTETLFNGNVFAQTGAGQSLDFNFSDSAIKVSEVTAGFGNFSKDGSQKAVPFPAFEFSLDCTTACGNGTSPPNASTFSFLITDGINLLSFSDFVGNGGYFFVSDIGIKTGNNTYTTGNVAASGPASVPEPSSLLLLGVGFVGLGMVRRKLAG